MKRIIITVLSLAALVLAANASLTLATGDKGPICHVPPGNPENAHTIYPNSEGYNGHFKNGGLKHDLDYFGECITATPTPEPSVEPSVEPSISEEPSPSPTPEETPEQTPEETPSETPTQPEETPVPSMPDTAMSR